MSQFKNYASYYEIVYQSKDYKSEIKYILDCMNKENVDFGSSLLEFGCGSGGHIPYFLEEGFTVSGIDLSNEMLNNARLNFPGADFYEGNIIDKELDIKFDLVVSLYHVINYLRTEYELSMAFKNASRHLNKGGLFAFDFWYGPAVLMDHPKELEKEFIRENVKVKRKTTPVMDYADNTVKVNFDFEIFINEELKNKFSETHLMKYLFLPELKYHLSANGFEILQCNSWLADKPLTEKNWYGFILAMKT